MVRYCYSRAHQRFCRGNKGARAFSLLKTPTITFTIKSLLHYAKWVFKVCCVAHLGCTALSPVCGGWRVTSGPRVSPSQPQLAPGPVLITTARRRDTRGRGNVTRAEPHAARAASWQGAPVITWTSENKPMNITQIMHSEYSGQPRQPHCAPYEP